MTWKFAQFFTWLALTVLLFEGIGRDMDGSGMLPSMLVALAITAVFFGLLMRAQLWLSSRSVKKLRRHQ